MAEPTKKISALPVVTASSAADSIPIVRAGVTSRIHPASGGGLDADTVDGYQAATLYIPRGYIDGLICSNAADAEHDITIAVGVARDSTNVMPLILASAITKRIDAEWTAGDNAGGIDTGSVAADTPYFIWIIRKDSDGSIDALFSLSATAPTMPAGYTYKRRIMSLMTDASANIIPTRQCGDLVLYNTPILDRAPGAITNTNRTAYTLTTPPSVIAIVNIMACNLTTSATETIWIGGPGRTDSAPAITDCDIRVYTRYQYINLVKEILLTASQSMYARGSSTDIGLQVFTLGWIDDRRRNA